MRGSCENGRVSTEHKDTATPDGPTPTEKKLRRALAALTVLLLVSWLLMLVGLPLSLLSGVTGVVALVLLVRTVILTLRQGRRGTAVFTAIFGFPAITLIILSALTSALFYGPMLEAQECQRNALTEQARSACDAQVKQSSISWVSQLFGG